MSKIVSAIILNEKKLGCGYAELRISEEALKILLDKPYEFECFIGKPPYDVKDFDPSGKGLYSNLAPEKALLLYDIFLKSQLQQITMESLREFAYLTNGSIEFLLIADDGKRAAFKLNGGRLLRARIYTKKNGKLGDEIFL